MIMIDSLSGVLADLKAVFAMLWKSENTAEEKTAIGDLLSEMSKKYAINN